MPGPCGHRQERGGTTLRKLLYAMGEAVEISPQCEGEDAFRCVVGQGAGGVLAPQRDHCRGVGTQGRFEGVRRRQVLALRQRRPQTTQVVWRRAGDTGQRSREPRLQMLWKRFARYSPDHDKVMPQPEKRAQQGSEVEAGMEMRHPLLFGLGRDRPQLSKCPTDLVLELHNRRRIPRARKAGDQVGEKLRRKIEHAARRLEFQDSGVCRQHQQGDDQTDDRPESYLDDAIES